MKTSELRIGNLVQAKSPERQEWESLVVVTTTYLKLFIRNKVDFKPIPLTLGWLLKFGFVEHFIGNKFSESWYELKYLSNEHEPIITSWVSILINIETWSCVICDEYPDEIGANTKIKIEYVHQLQNLYFALTGEELTFKSE